MNFFRPRSPSEASVGDDVAAAYEIAYTCIDFLAGLLFVIGSILFFREATTQAGVWFYLIGSVGFTVRPAIHLWRMSRAPQRTPYDS